VKTYISTLLLLFVLSILSSNAQTPGIIVRPAGTNGPAVLDPNADAYTSATTSGFTTNDITSSEIPYKIVAPVISEPTGDLLRGPSGSFSDIVKTVDGSGLYLFNDGANLLVRLRIGGIVSGSKGYSILIDTDSRFGATGPNADPNYQPATSGTNGNPGFELEIVFETNFQIAVYNVDGTSSPVLMSTYPIASNSQVSVSSSTDSGDPDYFYDFYVPISSLGISTSTPIRIAATTVMSPEPAIGGPKSDIYGLDGNNYMTDWTIIINGQPFFTLGDLTSGGGGIGPTCTLPPVVNTPITSTTAAVTGTWTKLSVSTYTTATITLYKNGSTVLGTTNVISGNAWSINVSGLVDGDVITAKAQAVGESQCLTSNIVIVNSCSGTTHTATPVITCSSLRGFEGTRVAGASVSLFKFTSAGYVLYADDATTTYKVTYPSATLWRYDDVNVQSGSACTGGAVDIPAGEYYAIATLAPNCASLPAAVCITGTAAPTTPTVTSALIEGNTVITGTAAANVGVNLWINGYFVQSTTSDAGGAYTINLLTPLISNEQIEINSATTGSCVSSSFTSTVTCYVEPPLITANSLGQVSVGSQITGTSSTTTGITVTIYNATTNAVIGTTTVAGNGTWTLSAPAVTTGTTYYAISSASCGLSVASNTVSAVPATSLSRCGTITGPIGENATSVAGTVTTAVAGTTVTLYEDGISIGTTVIAGTTWTIPVNATINNTIYAGSSLTIGITEASSTEALCSASVIVDCTPPLAPVFSPVATIINAGETVTYTLTGTQTGILYSLRDNADATNTGTSDFGTGSTITLVSDPFNSPGSYTIKVKATSFSGNNCEALASASVDVLTVLPVSLSHLAGTLDAGIAKLNWTTSAEHNLDHFEIEKSYDGNQFSRTGNVKATGNSNSERKYIFNDSVLSSTIIYYRLKMVDIDGKFKRSNVIVLRKDKGVVVNFVSPNPFTEVINVSMDAAKDQRFTITLNDMGGRVIRKFNYNVKQGLNNLQLSNLKNISSGTYMIQINAGEEKISRQLIIKN
jgi:hypothetical protein